MEVALEPPLMLCKYDLSAAPRAASFWRLFGGAVSVFCLYLLNYSSQDDEILHGGCP